MSTPPVRWTEIFETIEPDAFEDLALIAAEVCGAPIALVTLVDENRQWFTSAVGTRLPSSAWEDTFCAHAVRQLDLFVVSDALADARFANTALVVSEPHVRFYAGVPLVIDGAARGTLCSLDTSPRALSAHAAASLRALSRQVVMQLQLRRQTLELSRLNDALTWSEERVRQSQAHLQRADSLRRELVAGVSHDLRTPLTSLQGYLETLQLKPDTLTSDDRRRYLDTAVRHSQRLGRLVDDLFDLAQLDHSEILVRRERFSVVELARDVLQTFELRAEDQRVTLRLDRDQSPPVSADVRLIERVLENLIENALHVTRPGGQIVVICEAGPEGVTVRVSDTGQAVVQPDVGHAVVTPVRAKSAPRRRLAAPGLGLSIARRILEIHRGHLHEVSSPDGGTELSFTLPYAD